MPDFNRKQRKTITALNTIWPPKKTKNIKRK